MSSLVDLTGRRLKHAVVRSLEAERGPYGALRWVCRCDCGRKFVADGNNIRAGKTNSCGCHKGEGGYRMTRAEARRRYRAAETRKVDGEEWYSPRMAKRHSRYGHWQLSHWIVWPDGTGAPCPYLRDERGKPRGIRIKMLKDGLGQETVFYAKADLDIIRKVRLTPKLIPELPGLRSTSQSQKDLRIGYSAFQRLLTKKEVEPEYHRGTDKNGKGTDRSYLPDLTVQAEVEERLRWVNNPDAISRRDTADLLGMSINGVQYRVDMGVLHPQPGTIFCRGNYLRPGYVFSRKEVEACRISRHGQAGTDGAALVPIAAMPAVPQTPPNEGARRGKRGPIAEASNHRRSGVLLPPTQCRRQASGDCRRSARAFQPGQVHAVDGERLREQIQAGRRPVRGKRVTSF